MARSVVAPITPDAERLRDALARSAPLASLMQRQRDSQARCDAARSVLPPSLAPHVRPGPLDADAWTLLAANGAVAAKLRQLQPRIEAALHERGLATLALRIKTVAA